MSSYIVGSFARGKSGSPYSFVCKDVRPGEPFAVLNTKRTRGIEPFIGTPYLLEIKDWTEPDPRVQYVERVIAPIMKIQQELVDALWSAEWVFG